MVNVNDTKSNRNDTPTSTGKGSVQGLHKNIAESSPDCRKCMDNLLSTLDSIQSKPFALFQAMGVNVASYERHGAGIKVHIPAFPSSLNTSSSSSSSTTTTSTNSTRSTQTPNRVSRGGRSMSIDSIGFGFGGGRDSSDDGGRVTDKATDANANTNANAGNNNDDDDASVMGKLRRQLTHTFHSASSQLKLAPAQSMTTAAATVATSAIETETAKSAIDLQIHCKKCGTEGPEGGARAYVRGPNPLSIVLCSNRLSTKEEIEQVLIHELIHVYDVHVRNWDLTNCYTLAKSEVRAAREAECSDAALSFTKRFCVKEKARVATKNMFPDLGFQCVNAMFEEAMRDHAPFVGQTKNERTNVNGGAGGYVRGRVFQSSYPSRSDQSTR